jgi:hypothetical protein
MSAIDEAPKTRKSHTGKIALALKYYVEIMSRKVRKHTPDEAAETISLKPDKYINVNFNNKAGERRKSHNFTVNDINRIQEKTNVRGKMPNF